MKFVSRTKINLSTLLLISLSVIFSCDGCVGKSESTQKGEDANNTITPLNITVLLDLSDRIKQDDNTGNTKYIQLEKDSILLMNIQKSFYNNQAPNGKFKVVGNRIKVICYPYPQDVSKLEDMEFDMKVNDPNDISNKQKQLLSMDSAWKTGISYIYRQAKVEVDKDPKFPGSDIWSFFNGPVEVECVEDGYRNILLILTDGYIYHKNSWKKNGTVCRGILSETLKSQTAIEPINKEYENLEVMFLEINTSKGTPEEFDKIEKLLTDWCNNMGIQKVKVVQTNSPQTTKSYVDKFIGW